MTVINTNVGALTARTYAVKATANTETAMERLSSGFGLTQQLTMLLVSPLQTKWKLSSVA